MLTLKLAAAASLAAFSLASHAQSVTTDISSSIMLIAAAWQSAWNCEPMMPTRTGPFFMRTSFSREIGFAPRAVKTTPGRRQCNVAYSANVSSRRKQFRARFPIRGASGCQLGFFHFRDEADGSSTKD